MWNNRRGLFEPHRMASREMIINLFHLLGPIFKDELVEGVSSDASAFGTRFGLFSQRQLERCTRTSSVKQTKKNQLV